MEYYLNCHYVFRPLIVIVKNGDTYVKFNFVNCYLAYTCQGIDSCANVQHTVHDS